MKGKSAIKQLQFEVGIRSGHYFGSTCFEIEAFYPNNGKNKKIWDFNCLKIGPNNPNTKVIGIKMLPWQDPARIVAVQSSGLQG